MQLQSPTLPRIHINTETATMPPMTPAPKSEKERLKYSHKSVG